MEAGLDIQDVGGLMDQDERWEAILEGTAYHARGRLGRGGMGLVLDAEHIALRKPVVVKVLHRELARREDLVDRMRVEAQVLARLRHPNVVDVTDFGRTRDGRPYDRNPRPPGTRWRAPGSRTVLLRSHEQPARRRRQRRRGP